MLYCPEKERMIDGRPGLDRWAVYDSGDADGVIGENGSLYNANPSRSEIFAKLEQVQWLRKHFGADTVLMREVIHHESLSLDLLRHCLDRGMEPKRIVELVSPWCPHIPQEEDEKGQVECFTCGRLYWPKSPQHRFCSGACRIDAKRARSKARKTRV